MIFFHCSRPILTIEDSIDMKTQAMILPPCQFDLWGSAEPGLLKGMTARQLAMLPLLLKFVFELFQVWPRDRVVQLLSHPGMLNLTYPCVTNQDGTDPGDLIRKVAFWSFPRKTLLIPRLHQSHWMPSLWDSHTSLLHKVSPSSQTWPFYLRYLNNGSIYYLDGDLDFWGYCRPGCGEQVVWLAQLENQRRPTLTEPQEAAAPERWSLAGQEELWETSIYDLRTWEVLNYDVNTVVLHVQCANLGQYDFCRLGSATRTTLHLSLTPILHHVFQAFLEN